MDLHIAKEIKLEDQALFNSYLQKYPPQTSEFTFTNLYMWRNFYGFNFMEWREHLLLFSHTMFEAKKIPASGNKNSLYFFPPLGPNPTEIIISLFKELKDLEFHRVPETITDTIHKNIDYQSLNLQILEDRDNWDYVYETENLRTLPGNQYRQNRRWLNKFLENYDYEFKILTENEVNLMKKLQLEWCILRQCEDDESLKEEELAIYDALDNYSTLGFHGALICVDEKCAAYTFGEMLNTDTMVIHVEKAHMDYEGAYQAINNLFLKNNFKDVLYVNREQDLGVPGLRRAKESYKPLRMEKKSIIYRKI
ncbi:MAG TPA: phosphatidylglycerol lysyltransferase domain-containing protein [Candidatus Nanopelagicaceae bacterium]|nr:phosphatidylglycerol lysyltransferase domain-containing protein [Candidatus Nanopelagicaceae bacterium]